MLSALERIQEDLLRPDAEGEMCDEFSGLNTEQLIYRPIAEEVLRSLRG